MNRRPAEKAHTFAVVVCGPGASEALRTAMGASDRLQTSSARIPLHGSGQSRASVRIFVVALSRSVLFIRHRQDRTQQGHQHGEASSHSLLCAALTFSGRDRLKNFECLRRCTNVRRAGRGRAQADAAVTAQSQFLTRRGHSAKTPVTSRLIRCP